MDLAAADSLVASLDPADGPIERVDTHISALVFQNGWAYKIKRPVRYEFIDLSTAQRREDACRRELTLNRRFSPDVYDSVIPIHDPTGAVIDHAVRMRRMPAERRLSTLISSNDPRVPDQLRAVARIMAAVHSRADRGPDIDRLATPDALALLWRRSLDDARRFAGPILDPLTLTAIDRRAERYLTGRTPLLLDRIARGHIVDGHGDLLADDIFALDDGPRILDCLEFDDALRAGDVLADIAFLLMDLDRLGHPELARQFAAWYAEFSDEHHPASLLDHYIAYRALVRAKVACLRAAPAGEPTDEAVAQNARQYLALAARHLARAEVSLVIVGGLPGSGKSTLASSVGAALDWPVLRSDVIRKELAGAGPGPQPAPYRAGIYAPGLTEATYDEVLRRAATSLRHGQSAIIDASFLNNRLRERAADVARQTRSRFVPMCCTAPSGMRYQRLLQRPHDLTNPSDVTPQVAARMAAEADAWPNSFAIDTSESPGRSVRDALGVLHGLDDAFHDESP